MKLNKLRLVAAAVALSGAAVSAQASTLTFNSWTYGSGTAVDVTAPTYLGQGGSFNGTVSLASAPFNTTFNMYCVELTQGITVPGTFTGYTVVSATSQYGAVETLQLAKLLTHANPLVTNAVQSTALQLAIWNVIYDNDLSVSAGSGSFFDSAAGGASSTTEALANSFLSDSSATLNNLQLFVLKSANNQDQLIWLAGGGPTAGNIPEPTSLALAFGALGALGFSTRRRALKKA